MLVPLVLTVLTQPAPLVEKATEAAVSAQPTPPTEKAAGEAAPPTEKWVTSSCGLSGCVHTNHLTGTTTAHDWQGGKVTSNKWTGQVTASNHQGTYTTNLHTGNWHATGCSALGCGTHGGNKYSGHYWATPHYLRKIDEAGELVATHAGVFAATGAFAAVFLAVGLLRRSRASRPEAATAEAPAVQLV